MALTITIEGKGVIANCDALTNDTGGTGTGDWSELGGGSISLTNDVYLYGSACVAGAYSNKSGYQRFDLGVGNELDFDTSGAEEGQHLYMWIHCPTIGLLESKANKGLAIRLATGDTDYREYLIAGNDDSNEWAGGWRCFVIDPTKSGSYADTGTYDPGSIRYVGVWIETAALAKGDNIFIDQIAVGFGLRITGTSTTGWGDAVGYCTDYVNRAWGMLQEREGIYYAYGKIWIGDSTQTAATSFTDTGRIIQYGISEYWSGSAWVTSADIDYSGIVIEDATGYATTFQDGTLVGTDGGRSGSVVIGNANHDVSMDLYGGGTASSIVKLYGTSFKNITGSFAFGDDPDFHVYGCTFEGCSQIDPVGAPIFRNCNFISTVAESALLWNDSINIRKCNFIANTDVTDFHAIEHPAASSYTYYSLVFSGNDYDIYYTAAASSGVLEISKDGTADPTTYEILNPAGNSVSIVSSVTLTLVNVPMSAEVSIIKVSDRSELFHVESSDGNDIDYNYGTGEIGLTADVLVMHLAYDPNLGQVLDYTLPGSSTELPIALVNDAVYYNPT